MLARLKAQGIEWMQIDEPALHEGLPLKSWDWNNYLGWATRTFRVAASSVDDSVRIHTHMCYAEFNNILLAIASMLPGRRRDNCEGRLG